MKTKRLGNPRRLPKRRRRVGTRQHRPQAVPRPRLTLHQTDPITGHEEQLSSLFYEFHRGYTIYRTEQGQCCIHGKDGCLQIEGRFVCFPTLEQAKRLIKWFRIEGYTAQNRMQR
jgi:hypothetical protein